MSSKTADRGPIDWRNPKSYISPLGTAKEWNEEYKRHAVFLFPDFTKELRRQDKDLPDPDLEWGHLNASSDPAIKEIMTRLGLDNEQRREKSRDAAKKNFDSEYLEFMLESLPDPGKPRLLPDQMKPDELGIIIDLRFSPEHTLQQLKSLVRGAQKHFKVTQEPFKNRLSIDGDLALRCLQTWDARALDILFEEIGEVTHSESGCGSWAARAGLDYKRALMYFAEFAAADLLHFHPLFTAITRIF